MAKAKQEPQLRGRQIAKVKDALGDWQSMSPDDAARAFNTKAKELDYSDSWCTPEIIQKWQAKGRKRKRKVKAASNGAPAAVRTAPTAPRKAGGGVVDVIQAARNLLKLVDAGEAKQIIDTLGK